MSDSEEEGNIAFSSANDFEDGRWIGDHFYAKGQKRGRHASREEQLYGVFAESDGSSGDDDGKKIRGKRQRKKHANETLSAPKPMSFVTETSQISQKEENIENIYDDDIVDADAESDDSDKDDITESFKDIMKSVEAEDSKSKSNGRNTYFTHATNDIIIKYS